MVHGEERGLPAGRQGFPRLAGGAPLAGAINFGGQDSQSERRRRDSPRPPDGSRAGTPNFIGTVGVRFELTKDLHPYWFSRPAPSTTQPSHHSK